MKQQCLKTHFFVVSSIHDYVSQQGHKDICSELIYLGSSQVCGIIYIILSIFMSSRTMYYPYSTAVCFNNLQPLPVIICYKVFQDNLLFSAVTWLCHHQDLPQGLFPLTLPVIMLSKLRLTKFPAICFTFKAFCYPSINVYTWFRINL